MRKARQVGFSAIILKISSRISLVTGLLPIGLRARDMSRQYSWKPQRCQRTTVSGDTRIRVFSPRRPETAQGHPEQPVGNTKSGAGILPFEHGELLAKREILN